MSKNWHHFSAKEHAEFLIEHGFRYSNTQSSHEFYVKVTETKQCVVQVIINNKEKHRQSRKTMDMSLRHSGIPKSKYKDWINKI